MLRLSIVLLGVLAVPLFLRLRRRLPPSASAPASLWHNRLLEPLKLFFVNNQQPLPLCESVNGQDIPQPYQSLLFHQHNMTPTLHRFHQSSIHLRVLSREFQHEEEKEWLTRWILLHVEKPTKSQPSATTDLEPRSCEASAQSEKEPTSEHKHKTVEFAAIRISIHNLPSEVAQPIRDGVRPFGSILIESGVRQESHPALFFKIAADKLLKHTMRWESLDPTYLYGRVNVITTPDGKVLAESIEVLPPIHTKQSRH